jgi:predicted DNA-binding transcriptional regulator AlpA
MQTDQQPVTLTVVLDSTSVGRLFDLVRRAAETAIQPEVNPRAIASRRALFAGNEPPEDEKWLVNTRQTANLLDVSERKVFAMQTEGRMPAPLRIGKAVRWRKRELEAWIDAGSPPLRDWKWPSVARQ